MSTLTDAVNALVTNTTTLQTTVTGRITDMDGKIASADTAKVAAEAAKAGAEVAKSLADTAKTDAETAKTLAENAKVAAEAAKTTAATAKTDALLAKAATDTAKGNAVAAQSAAESARGNAEEWASKTSGAVAGGEMSAKYHAQTASTDAATATAKAAAALASANAAGPNATTAANAVLSDRYTKAETDAKIVALSPPTDISGKLSLSGGTMTGTLSIDQPSDYDKTTLTSLTNAPIMVPETNVGSTDTFLPIIHQKALYASGYRTHLNIGLRKDASGWGTGTEFNSSTGMYVALGGNDSNPTKAFNLTYNGNIFHSDGHKFWNSDNMSPSKVVFAGMDASHSQAGSTWVNPDLGSHYIAPNADYVTQSGIYLTIVKEGYYQVSGHVLMHDNGGSSMRCQTLVDDVVKQYTYLKASNGGWNTAYPTHSQHYTVGQKISFAFFTSGGNPYPYHSHTYHSRIYLTYIGT